MTNLPAYKAKPPQDAEQPGLLPAQFLPSTMLSWRVPIMVRHGLPDKPARRAVVFDAAALARHPLLRQAG